MVDRVPADTKILGQTLPNTWARDLALCQGIRVDHELPQFFRKALEAGAHFIGRLQGSFKIPCRLILRLPNLFDIRKVRDARLSGSLSMKHPPHLATDQTVELVGIGVRLDPVFQPLVNPINIRLDVADAT